MQGAQPSEATGGASKPLIEGQPTLPLSHSRPHVLVPVYGLK